MAGLTWAVIADEVGYAQPAGAHAACKRALDRIPKQDSLEYSMLTEERLNALLTRQWGPALDPRHADHAAAFERVLRLQDRLDRINGVGQETTQKVQVQAEVVQRSVLVVEGDQDQFVAAMRRAQELAGMDRPVLEPADIELLPDIPGEVHEAEVVENG